MILDDNQASSGNGNSPQVFDATNTTRERREVILTFAKENGYKVSETGELMSRYSSKLMLHL